MINEDLEQRLIELPEIQAEKGIWQNKFHEFDVYDHTMSFVEHAKMITSDTEIIVAGYLHDIGKPVVRTLKIINGVVEEKEPGKPYHQFHNHERVGEEMVRNMTTPLFLDYRLNQIRIACLVGAHYVPMKGIKEMRKTKDYNSFVIAYEHLQRTLTNGGLQKEDIMIMFVADSLAKGVGCTDIEELMLIREAILTDGNNIREIYNLQRDTYGLKN